MGYLKCVFGGLLLVHFMYIKNSDAIECYECNSYTDKRCLGDENNKLDDELLKKCPDSTADGKPYKLCRKIKQVIDFEVNGLKPESRIIRTCGWDDSSYKKRCYQRSGFGGRQEVCACEEDKCNHSDMAYPLIMDIVDSTTAVIASTTTILNSTHFSSNIQTNTRDDNNNNNNTLTFIVGFGILILFVLLGILASAFLCVTLKKDPYLWEVEREQRLQEKLPDINVSNIDDDDEQQQQQHEETTQI